MSMKQFKKMNMECKDPSENIESDEFYFESDHLALKGNKDYTDILKTIIILETQRTRALQDLDNLLTSRANAVNNPVAFVAQLQNNDIDNLSRPQKIVEIPHIDWSKYSISGNDARIRPQTRHGNFTNQVSTKIDPNEKTIFVRGRVFDESKPETFNQLWTSEEQKRLEQLLVEYPPEDIEMRRWTKIANALGNRTPKQVSSRVQKYFIKLLRAGLPIPGRGPKFKLDVKKSIHARHQRNNYALFRRSTFFPHHDLFAKDESLEKMETFENNSTIYGNNSSKQSTWNNSDYSFDNGYGNGDADQVNTDINKQILNKLKSVEGDTDNQKNYDTDYYFHNSNDSSYNYLDTNFLPE